MQAIPLSFFIFLAELAAGGILVTALLHLDGEVSDGFLFLNGAFLLGFALAGIWLRAVLPASRLLDYPAGEPWVHLELAAWGLLAATTALYLGLVKTGRGRAGKWVGLLAGAAGVGALAVSAAAYASPAAPGALLLATLLAGALALGTAWSGMMLGHWYLVTPLLAPRPLLRLNASLAAVLVGQAALLGLAVASYQLVPAWLFWLRAGVGIAFPLALALPVWRTARVRSMMSATGLLYIALGTILAGEIIAKALFFLTGIPV